MSHFVGGPLFFFYFLVAVCLSCSTILLEGLDYWITAAIFIPQFFIAFYIRHWIWGSEFIDFSRELKKISLSQSYIFYFGKIFEDKGWIQGRLEWLYHLLQSPRSRWSYAFLFLWFGFLGTVFIGYLELVLSWRSLIYCFWIFLLVTSFHSGQVLFVLAMSSVMAVIYMWKIPTADTWVLVPYLVFHLMAYSVYFDSQMNVAAGQKRLFVVLASTCFLVLSTVFLHSYLKKKTTTSDEVTQLTLREKITHKVATNLAKSLQGFQEEVLKHVSNINGAKEPRRTSARGIPQSGLDSRGFQEEVRQHVSNMNGAKKPYRASAQGLPQSDLDPQLLQDLAKTIPPEHLPKLKQKLSSENYKELLQAMNQAQLNKTQHNSKNLDTSEGRHRESSVASQDKVPHSASHESGEISKPSQLINEPLKGVQAITQNAALKKSQMEVSHESIQKENIKNILKQQKFEKIQELMQASRKSSPISPKIPNENVEAGSASQAVAGQVGSAQALLAQPIMPKSVIPKTDAEKLIEKRKGFQSRVEQIKKKIERWTSLAGSVLTGILTISILIGIALIFLRMQRRDPKQVDARPSGVQDGNKRLIQKRYKILKNSNLTAKDEVVKTYSLFLQSLHLADHSKPSWMTASDFYNKIKIDFEALSSSSQTLTNIYCETKYGEVEVSQNTLIELRRARDEFIQEMVS